MKVFLPLALAVVGVWLGTPFVMAHFVADVNMRGPTGDLYGSVNALFSGLAFAGLLATLWIQRRQLEMQREELGLQREELKAQRAEMVASRGELQRQVRAQHLLHEVAVAQVRVASIQSEIEAIKLLCAPDAPTAQREHLAQEALESAKLLRNLHASLERSTPLSSCLPPHGD